MLSAYFYHHKSMQHVLPPKQTLNTDVFVAFHMTKLGRKQQPLELPYFQ